MATAAAEVAVALAVGAVAVRVTDVAVAVVVEAKPAALCRRYPIPAEMNPRPRSGLRDSRRRGGGRAQIIVAIPANPAALACASPAGLVPPWLLLQLRLLLQLLPRLLLVLLLFLLLLLLLLLMKMCGPGVAISERSIGGSRRRRG